MPAAVTEMVSDALCVTSGAHVADPGLEQLNPFVTAQVGGSCARKAHPCSTVDVIWEALTSEHSEIKHCTF